MQTQKVIYKAKPIPTNKPSASTGPIYVSTTKRDAQKKTSRESPLQVRLPWYYNLLIIVLWVFIVFCVVEFVMARFRYLVYSKWWKNNGGNKYNKVFNIQLFAQFDSFYLGYWFLSLFQSGDAAIPSKGVARFINEMIITYAKINDQDENFLLPVNICETIIVGDRKGKDNPPEEKNKWDPETNWPQDMYTWKNLLKWWGMNTDSQHPPNLDKWMAAPDNFFWQKYSINPLAPVLQAFMLGTYEFNGVVWNPNALPIALGISPLSSGSEGIRGGWWGYVLYGFQTEKDLSYQTIIDSIKSAVPLDLKPPCDGRAKGLNWGGCIFQGLGSAAGIAPFMTLGPGGILAVAAAGSVGFAGAIINNYATGKCM